MRALALLLPLILALPAAAQTTVKATLVNGTTVRGEFASTTDQTKDVVCASAFHGLILWLDADDVSAVVKNGSDQVASWTDKATGFGPVAQTTDANKPVWTASRQNGRPGLVLTSASNQRLSVDTALVTAYPLTLFVVAKSADDTTAREAFYLGDKDATDVDMTFVRWAGSVAGNPFQLSIIDSAQTTATTASGFAAGECHIATCRWVSTTNRRVLIDGGNEGTASTSRVMQNYDRTTIGRQDDVTTANTFNGDMYEVLGFNVDVEDDRRTALQRYVGSKWAVTVP